MCFGVSSLLKIFEGKDQSGMDISEKNSPNVIFFIKSEYTLKQLEVVFNSIMDQYYCDGYCPFSLGKKVSESPKSI